MTPAHRITELERKLANVLRLGSIEHADYATARVRVRIGPLLTTWLPWLTSRAGGDRSWWAPEIGEQVLVLSPSGDMGQGVVMPALYSTAKPPPAGAETVHRMIYADGAIIEYDRQTHRLKADIPGNVQVIAAGDITAQATGKITATAGGNIEATAGGSATLQASGSVSITGASISLNGPIALNGAVTTSSTLAAAGAVTAASVAAPSISSGSIILGSHRHTGVSTGSGTSGSPTV